MALIGYARVSTEYQSLDTQIEALRQEGCIKIFAESASGGNRHRIAFRECLDYLREGDILVLYHSNRLARDTLFTLDILEKLQTLKVELRSIMDHVDVTTPAGKCMITVSAAIATMEREQNSLLVRDRLARARARGTVLGRRRKITPDNRDKLIHLVAMHEKGLPISYIEKEMGMSNPSIYRYLGIAKDKGLYPAYQPKNR